MNRLVIIGNGFDINLGLKTRYFCFYPYFIEHARTDNMIRNWIDGNERFWSDLEEKLGQELKSVPEYKLQQFYEDKEELDRLLIEYLEKEQEKYCFDDVEGIKKEFSRSMINFFAEMPVNDVDSLKSTMEKYKNEIRLDMSVAPAVRFSVPAPAVGVMAEMTKFLKFASTFGGL